MITRKAGKGGSSSTTASMTDGGRAKKKVGRRAVPAAIARAARPAPTPPAPRHERPLRNLWIRPALQRDRRAVAAIVKKYRLTPGFDQKEFRVAVHRGRVVACARLRFLGDSYELASLGVKESYRKRGVGTAMVRACIEAADGQVFCLTDIPAFVERLGFCKVPPEKLPGELVKKARDWCPSGTAALVHGGNPVAVTFRLLREKCEKDMGTTHRALDKVKISVPRRSHYRKVAEDFLSMAKDYYSDARHFFDRGDLVLAFACVNYAHGWLDSGARLGLFDVGEDDKLFTLAE